MRARHLRQRGERPRPACSAGLHPRPARGSPRNRPLNNHVGHQRSDARAHRGARVLARVERRAARTFTSGTPAGRSSGRTPTAPPCCVSNAVKLPCWNSVATSGTRSSIRPSMAGTRDQQRGAQAPVQRLGEARAIGVDVVARQSAAGSPCRARRRTRRAAIPAGDRPAKSQVCEPAISSDAIDRIEQQVDLRDRGAEQRRHHQLHDLAHVRMARAPARHAAADPASPAAATGTATAGCRRTNIAQPSARIGTVQQRRQPQRARDHAEVEEHRRQRRHGELW